MLTTMQDLLNQQVTDAAAITADNANVTADQAKLATDQALVVTDTSTATADASTLNVALVETGPLGTVNGNFVSIVAAPGTVIQPNTPYPLASSVAIPAPPAPPALNPPPAS